MPRRSKIEQQPEDVRTRIDRMLIQAGFAGYDWLVERIRDELGVDPGEKSSLQRYGSKLQRKLDAIQASSHAARLITEAAPDEADARSNANISLLQSEIFETMLALQDATDEDDPKKRLALLGYAAKAIAPLTRASIARNKWAAEVQGKLDAAAAAIKQIGTQAGISTDTMAAIDARLQGIV